MAGLPKKVPELCLVKIASYLTPAIAGPPVYTIAKHKGLCDDQNVKELCDNLGDLFDVSNDNFAKGWLITDFVVKDLDIQDELRAIREDDKFNVVRDNNNRLIKSKFMEWVDFDISPDEDITELNHMKLKLDKLTGRIHMEEDWNISDNISTEEKNQYRLCYNHLLFLCMFK